MSGKATGWVWDHARGLDPTAMLTLLAVAEAADHNGEGSFQSKATLAAMLSISERTVQRQLAELVAAGWLEVQAPARSPRPTTYRLPGMQAQGDTGVSPDTVDNSRDRETPTSPSLSTGRQEGDTGVIRALYGTGNNPPTPLRGEGDGDAGTTTTTAYSADGFSATVTIGPVTASPGLVIGDGPPELTPVDREAGEAIAVRFLDRASPRPAVTRRTLALRCGWQLARGYTESEVGAALELCESFTVAAIDGRCRAVRARGLHPGGSGLSGRETGAQAPLRALRDQRPPCDACHGAGVVLGEDDLARKCEDCP